MAKKCPNCGSENPEGLRFCGNCGRGLGQLSPARLGVVKCPSCGFDNPEGKRFCVGCGNMIPRIPRTSLPGQGREKKD